VHPTLSRRARRTACLAVATLGALIAHTSAAQTYPDKVVRIIVPFSSGGVTDVVFRPSAQRLASQWGQQAIIENRPGAGSTICAEAVAKAKPDGYTLLFTGNTHIVSASLYRKLSYDALNDFTPICLVGEQGSAVVVHPSVPAKNLAELLALAKSQPKKLNYASSGNGSSQHLFAALLWTMAGVELTHVPYKGSGPATTDLLSGLVPVSVPSISNVVNHIHAGKLRALATTGARRNPALPDVPTVEEAGIKGYEATLWFSAMGPKGLPPEIVNRVYESIVEALRSPDVLRAYASQGIEVRTMPPAEYAAFQKVEFAKWNRIVKESGATVD
jgi:tripartite-type tricarboxylate transporter receptor subunit TctC